MRAEYESVNRAQTCGGLRGNVQVNLSVGAREQRARGVRHVYFDQQRTGCHVDGFGCAHQLSLKLLPRKLSQTEICCHTDFYALRICLGDIYVNPQCSGLSDVKEIGFYAACATGVNEVADIGVARRNHPIEWRVDLLE